MATIIRLGDRLIVRDNPDRYFRLVFTLDNLEQWEEDSES